MKFYCNKFFKTIGLIGLMVVIVAIMIFMIFNLRTSYANTSYATMDVPIDENNFPDEVFRDYVKKFDTNHNGILSRDERNSTKSIKISDKKIADIKGIEFFQYLEEIYVPESNIAKVDITKNYNLTDITIRDAPLEKIDVSNLVKLTALSISGTRVQKLDLSNNVNLERLSISETKIHELNLNNALHLDYLNIANTCINGLDLTNHYAVSITSSANNNLAWFNLSDSNIIKFNNFKEINNVFDITVAKDSFDITKIFPGIDPNRIYDVENATLNGNIISGYGNATQIKYKYKCSNKQYPILEVILNITHPPKADSSITINDELGKIYDGKEIDLSKDDCVITGCGETVVFTYYIRHDDGSWEIIKNPPVNPGHYKVIAELMETDTCKGATCEKEFDILPVQIDDSDNNDVHNNINNENSDISKLSKDSKSELNYVKTGDKASIEMLVLIFFVSSFTLILMLMRKNKN